MLVCFEGLDGVGKSSIATTASQSFNIKLIEKPIKKLLGLTPEQSKEITSRLYSTYSSNVQAIYYLMGYLSALEDSKKEDLFFDRGLLSTYYFSFNAENQILFDALVNNSGIPELTIVLYASIEERLNRIKQRDKADRDLDKKRLYVDEYMKFFEGINRYQLPYYLINTENLNQQQVSEICNKLVGNFLQTRTINSSVSELLSIENLDNNFNMSYDELEQYLNAHLQLDNKKEYCLKKKP